MNAVFNASLKLTAKRESTMDRIGRELRLSGFKANAAQFQAGVENCTQEHVTALMGYGFPVGSTSPVIAERIKRIRSKIHFIKNDDWMRRMKGLALLAYKQALIAETQRYHTARTVERRHVSRSLRVVEG